MLWGQLQFFAGLLTVNEKFTVLGSLDGNLAFQIVTVVHIKGKQTHALAVCERWNHLPVELARGR